MTRPPDLPPYPQYKPSGIPWLDDIPAHWETRRLKYSAVNVTKMTSQRNEDEITLALENVESWSGRYADAGPDVQFDSQLKRFQVGDVLFGKLRPYLAKVAVPNRPGLCVGEFLVLRPREDVLLPEYLWMLLRSPTVIDVISASSFGAKMPRTDWRFVGGMRLPLPPPDEQAAIARYLDHKDALIQRYLHAKRRLVPLLQQLRKSTIHYAVTRGLDPENTPTKPSGIPWLGDIPAHWEMRRLKYSAVNVTKMTSQRNEDEITLALENVESWSGRYADAGPDVQFDSQLKRFQVGDVLFGKLRPYLAKVALPNRPGLCVGEFLVLRPREDVLLPEYLWMLLRSPTVIDVISASSFGAKMPRTDWRFVGGMRLPAPPLDEQAAIAEYLGEKTAVIDAAIAGTSRLIDLVQQYRASLIHHVVTGKRDVRQAAAALPDA